MLTQSERRGLSLLVLVFAIGAARDLWTWHRLGMPHPPVAPLSGTVTTPPSADPGLRSAAETAAVPDTVHPMDERIDLNRATASELDRLPGIGPVLAGRILEHRARYGPFREADELLAVPGIGPRLLERLQPRVRLGDPGSGAGREAPSGR